MKYLGLFESMFEPEHWTRTLRFSIAEYYNGRTDTYICLIFLKPCLFNFLYKFTHASRSLAHTSRSRCTQKVRQWGWKPQRARRVQAGVGLDCISMHQAVCCYWQGLSFFPFCSSLQYFCVKTWLNVKHIKDCIQLHFRALLLWRPGKETLKAFSFE